MLACVKDSGVDLETSLDLNFVSWTELSGNDLEMFSTHFSFFNVDVPLSLCLTNMKTYDR